MENVVNKTHKNGNQFRRKFPKRKIITPREYGVLSPADIKQAGEIFKILREKREASK